VFTPVAAGVIGASPVEPELVEYLRQWRRNIARDHGVPAYVVLHDTTLNEICRVRPSSIPQLLAITGIGERKAESYGQEILAALHQYEKGERAAALPEIKTAPMKETLRLVREGKTFAEIAAIRGRQVSTVIHAVVSLVESGELPFSAAWVDPTRIAIIEAACGRVGSDLQQLRPIKDVLPPEISYDEIRLVAARLRHERRQAQNGIPA
jgi:ATP-dependent DNA helicase RecQ